MLTPLMAAPQGGGDINVEMVRAARAGDAARVSDLLDRGAQVDAKVLLGNGLGTAISEAASRGFSDVVRLLVDAGGDVNLIDNNGWTPLMSAENPDIVRLLVSLGAEVDATDVNGWTALMILEDLDAVEALLEAGARPNARNTFGWTTLMSAAFGGLTDKVRLLLATGVEVDSPDNQGRTSLMVAYRGDRSAVEVLIQAGADPNGRDETGSTALMAAALSVADDKVQFLIDAGADLNVRDDQGRTALMLADSLGHTRIADILREAGAEE